MEPRTLYVHNHNGRLGCGPERTPETIFECHNEDEYGAFCKQWMIDQYSYNDFTITFHTRAGDMFVKIVDIPIDQFGKTQLPTIVGKMVAAQLGALDAR